MHQDIQNFSDLQDIDPKLTVNISIKVHGLVVGTVLFNGQKCYPGNNSFVDNLREPMYLESTIDQFEEGTSAVEITDFTVNGYNVVPLYQHLSNSGNGYHDYRGVWMMSIPKPFYRWYHAVSGQGWIA